MKDTSKYILFLCLMFTSGVHAQVGIGTTDPQSALHIVDSIFPQLVITSAPGVDSSLFGVNGVGDLNIETKGINTGNIIFRPKGAVGIGTIPELQMLLSLGNDTDRFSFNVDGSRLQIWNDANPPVLVFEIDSAGLDTNGGLTSTSQQDMNFSLESGSPNESIRLQTQDGSGSETDRMIISNYEDQAKVDIVNADLDVDNGVFYVDSDNDRIGIGTDDPKSVLDVRSTTSGILMPRMSTVQRTGYSNPQEGSIVYDVTDDHLYLYDGSTWKQLD
ncbi:MAG: hypothetical protein WD077_04290 [Bacteroidia bacterium]